MGDPDTVLPTQIVPIIIFDNMLDFDRYFSTLNIVSFGLRGSQS